MTEKESRPEGQIEGRITKALGGFYYVQTREELLECRARGIFRRDEITPYVGDNVLIERTDEGKGYIMDILERRNHLIRPPIANIDQLMIVISTVSPAPNFLVVDKIVAVAEYKGIEPVIVVTKTDMRADERLVRTYEQAGYRALSVDYESGTGLEEVKQLLRGKVTAFTGNSGVGKSTLINAIDPHLGLATAGISEKLGRGKHTTRHVELFSVCGGFVADTPGFSSIELERFAVIFKDKLQYCFREFEPYIQNCRFTGCSHTIEKGCAVLAAVQSGEISPSRHNSYLTLYEDAKRINEWETQSAKERSK